ncbi:Myb/SANT-like domain, partial [Dillenia turbinata]
MGKLNKQQLQGNEGKREKLTWKDKMDEVLLNAFIEEEDKGNRIDGTWTTTAYTNSVKKLGFTINKEHVKNHLRTLKNNFGICYDFFHGNSGFGWNLDTKLFEAELSANPDMGKWKHTPISHYDKLEMLYSKDRANGKGAISAKERVRQR